MTDQPSPSSEAKARELARHITPHLSLHPEQYTLDEETAWLNRNQDIIAAALDLARAQGRREGLEEASQVAYAQGQVPFRPRQR